MNYRKNVGDLGKSNNSQKAFEQAVGYLGYRDRTSAEIRKYLDGKGFSVEAIDEAVARLEEYGYLNDYRYCQLYYKYAISRNKGKRRIITELAGKGVAKDVIVRAINDLTCGDDPFGIIEDGEEERFDEKLRALEVGKKMARQQLDDGKKIDDKFKARVARRLAGLGYSADTVYYTIGKLRKEDE